MMRKRGGFTIAGRGMIRGAIARVRAPHVGLTAALLSLLGCPPPESRPGQKPAGTPTDPVEVCEHSGEVCRYDGAQLGVCNAAATRSGTPACPGSGPCFACVPQH